MNHCFKQCCAITLLLVAVQAEAASGAEAGSSPAPPGKRGAASPSYVSVWFYRDGIRVVPEISKRWLSVVFDSSGANDLDPGAENPIPGEAKAMLKAHNRLVEYLYDPSLADDACFFRMRDGLKPQEMSLLINQLKQDKKVKYVHPTLVLNNKTFAYFNTFEMEWKTGIEQAQQDSLLKASHSVSDDTDEKGKRFTVDVAAIPYFKALNLLSEDIKVLRVTPYLVEIKPAIRAKLALSMSGGNIGDSIPFTLSIAFSDRVNIDPSSLATLNLRPPELQKDLFDCTFDSYDYAKAVTKSPIVITGRVRFYAPGQFSLPPVKISYSCPSCPNSAVRSIESEPVLFKVSSMIPEDQSQYRLMVPTDPLAPDFRLAALHQQSRRFLWSVAVICGAGIVLCLGWLFLLLRRKFSAYRYRRREREKDALLVNQLRTLLQGAPTVPHWSYLGEVGSLLRKYLVVFCGGDLRYRGGSGRQFMATIGERLPLECVSSLSGIFTVIDDCVSLQSEQCQDIDQLQRDILQVVDLTAHNGAPHG